MNCTDCREQLVACLEDALSAQDAQDVTAHLETCTTCRLEAAEQHRLRERMEANALALSQPSLDTRVMDRILRAETFKSRRIAMRKRYGLAALAVAASVVLAVSVGLWPAGKSKSGHVYALSDVPQLLNSATTLHSRSLVYVPVWAPPDQERYIWARDCWVDQVTHCFCKRTTYVGKRPGRPAGDSQMQYGGGDGICDGQYVMFVDHRQKTVTYEKPTPFKLRYRTRQWREGVIPHTIEYFGGCTYSGQEVRDGEPQQIWETVDPLGNEGFFKRKLWFSPQKGEVGRIEAWGRSPKTNGEWVQGEVMDQFERDAAPPPGTFSTEPPAGYRLINTKQNAKADTLETGEEIAQVGERVARGHVSFRLPDRTLLLGWSCMEKGEPSASQEELFKDLVPGGPLPKLPLEIQALLPSPRMGTAAYVGFHVASTHKDGCYYEWALYVPNQPLPSTGIRSLDAECRVNTEGPDKPERHAGWNPSNALHVRTDTAADFNEFVLTAMAELSDTGTAPAGVTYDGVMQLSRQIRESPGKR